MKLYPLLTLATLPLLATAQEQPTKPNIIFLLMDDLGIGEIGVNGQQLIETPNIDALARSGKTMTQHYSGAPVSAPSRCVLLTGKHTGHSFIRGNDEMRERGDVHSHQAMFDDPSLEGQRPLPPSEMTIAKTLKTAGYTTACIGKWGLGAPNTDSEPNRSGFDFFYGYNCQRLSHSYYPTHLWRNSERELLDNKVLQPDRTRLAKGADPLDPRSYDFMTQTTYAPDKMFDATIEFIDANRDRPFFIWWTTPLPHVSLQAPKELVDYYVEKFGDEKPFLGDSYFPTRYPHATYAAMVTYIDRQVGELVAKLKRDGLYDNTLIIFTSDNGPTFNGGTDSPWFDSARPYQSEFGWGKCSLHEGGINVPTFVVWNNKIAANSKSNHLSGFQDWYPTLSQVAGAETPSGIDGISMVNTLINKGKQKQHKGLYWEYPELGGSLAVRMGKYKLIVNNIRKSPEYALYDLELDPREQQNIIKKYPKVAERLKTFARESHIAPDNKRFAMDLPL